MGPTGYVILLVKRALTLLALAACAHTPEPAVTKTESPWLFIHVADGAANGYHFTRAADGSVQFVYEPVRPEQSSTGFYSGGPPREETLDAADPRLTELWATLQKLAADETKHTPDRAKGTGAIAWDGLTGKRDFIIVMGPDLDALLAQLKRFGVER